MELLMPNGEAMTDGVGQSPRLPSAVTAADTPVGQRFSRYRGAGPGDPVRTRASAPRRFGFTFIELMIVMAIIAILLAVALPKYTRSIQRSKESVLKNNLFTLRTVIDEYTYDKQKAPQTLQDLVSDGYLRQVPIDPITGSADTWKIIPEDATNTVNQTQPGIYNVCSGADGTSLEGTPYSDCSVW
jgi:general secretion pathway protein G